MSNRLTAEEARKIAMDWRHNTCSKYVDELLKKIKEAALRGELEILAKDPSDIPFVMLHAAMTELGYKACGANQTNWTYWKWNE